MPLAAREHGHAATNAFLWGLLPDNADILDRWASRFHVSPRSAFGLIQHIGEDCPGAVQFFTPERREMLDRQTQDQVQWLTEKEIHERLAALEADASLSRLAGGIGQFSLAGAQAKTALYFDGKRWGVPSGRTPTTHILKPVVPGFPGHVENEHLCLALARAMGLPAARSEVRLFGRVSAIIVERYDRVRIEELATATAAQAAAEAASAAASAESLHRFAATTRIFRAHQEDMCQALGHLPGKKYQNQGALVLEKS